MPKPTVVVWYERKNNVHKLNTEYFLGLIFLQNKSINLKV